MTILFFIAYFAVAISYLSVDIKVLCEIYHMVRRFGGQSLVNYSSFINHQSLAKQFCQMLNRKFAKYFPHQ